MTFFRGNKSFLSTLLLCFLACRSYAGAQQPVPPSTLTGIVTDPSGAVIANASVVLHPGSGPDKTATTARNGHYTVSGDPTTPYTVIVNAEGFAPSVSEPLTLAAHKTLDVTLKIESATQQVDVSDTGDATDPAKNGDALILTGKAIDQLPLDPNELQQQLTALAGGDSPEFSLNGFSGGTIPPRDTIREIRINQTPYSAQNDNNPGNGYIQIFTKPGSGKFHGDVYSYGNASFLNTRNPFVTDIPPYHSYNLYSSIGGPITKHMSFNVNGGFGDSASDSIVNAEILDSSLNQTTFSQAIPSSNISRNLGFRIDASPGPHSTLTVNLGFSSATTTNGGIGQFNLASQGYNSNSLFNSLQISNSQVLSTHLVMDTRFQYQRSRTRQTPNAFTPTILVQGAFTSGGNASGANNDNQDRYEFQNYFSQDHGKQYFTYGARIRDGRDANHSQANYNGEYVFPTLAAYQATMQALAAGATSASGASQFSITTGSPNVVVSVADLGLFFQDDYKLRPNLTVSAGLRYEVQNQISDRRDFAPRASFALSLFAKKGKPAPYVVRGGAGVFYRRFASGTALQAARQNGVSQQQYIIANPLTYPNIPTIAALGAAVPSTIYKVNPNFQAPHLISSTVSLERKVGSIGSVTASYFFQRGVHTQLERNINAPLPGTYIYGIPTSGVRPLGTTQNIYEYESAGLYTEHRFAINYNFNIARKYFLYGSYQHRIDVTDDNNGGFASNQYFQGADFGRSANVPANQVNAGAGLDLPFGFNTYTFMRATSGTPFNIVVGQDLNGDTQFNDRPSFATDLTRASVVRTAYGNFDTLPVAGQTIIPANYGTGPAFVTVGMQLGRSFSFGPTEKPAAGTSAPKLKPGEKLHVEHRYNLNISIDAQNLFNHPNYGIPVGTLNSPLFGKSTSLASNFSSSTANRIVNLQAYFHF